MHPRALRLPRAAARLLPLLLAAACAAGGKGAGPGDGSGDSGADDSGAVVDPAAADAAALQAHAELFTQRLRSYPDWPEIAEMEPPPDCAVPADARPAD